MSRDDLPLDGTRVARMREAADMDEEIRSHIEHRIDDLMAEGVGAEEARARALAEFGDAERIRAESRAVREGARTGRSASERRGWDAAVQDLAFSLRQLRRQPGFALTAILTLALGIGSAVTIASVVRTVVLEPLPFGTPDRIVFPEMLTPDGRRFSVAEAVYPDWRAELRSFEELAALHVVSRTLRSPGQPRSVRVGRATHTLLDVLAVAPEVGRYFRAEEDLAAAPAAVAVLGHDTWRTDFGSDPGVVGSSVDLDGGSYEVVGVLPRSYEMLYGGADFLIPMGPDASLDREDHYLAVVARLGPGVTMEAADAELKSLQDRLSATYGADVGWTTHLRTARQELIGESVETAGRVLMAAALLLLLMACVNVSNLLMVRTTTRGAEMAVRTAIGASSARLTQQLVTETAVLASVGGTLGLLASSVALPTVRSLGSARIPRLDQALLDAWAAGATLAAVGVVVLLCGLAPALQVRGRGFATALVGTRGRGADPGRRIRSLLVIGQIAVTVVLLSGSGLLLRSFLELSRVDPGFDAEGTLAFAVEMPDAAYTWEERGDLFPVLREAVASVPGVIEVGATAVDPFSGSALANVVASEADLPDRAADFTPIQWRVVTPGFFEAMGMELLAGRSFRDADGWEDGMPIVIGASLARAMWGDADAIGRRMVWGDPDGSRMTVVGVVEDLRDVALDEDPLPIVYRSHRSVPWAVMTMVARVEGDPAAVVAGVRSRVAEAAPELPLGDFRSLEENLDRAMAEPRFNLQILAVFALLGLLMAVVGVYGLTAFDVRRRLPEIGIRLSLGASAREVQWQIVRERMTLSLLGVGIGLALAAALSGAVRSLLYGVTTRDPQTWLAVVFVVVGAALTATVLPARRATRVDPVSVLSTGE